jgi:hypothetical protein
VLVPLPNRLTEVDIVGVGQGTRGRTGRAAYKRTGDRMANQRATDRAGACTKARAGQRTITLRVTASRQPGTDREHGSNRHDLHRAHLDSPHRSSCLSRAHQEHAGPILVPASTMGSHEFVNQSAYAVSTLLKEEISSRLR